MVNQKSDTIETILLYFEYLKHYIKPIQEHKFVEFKSP